jgi:hypothetical protein
MSTKDELKTFAAIQGLYCCHGRTGQLVNLFDYEALEKQRDELRDILASITSDAGVGHLDPDASNDDVMKIAVTVGEVREARALLLRNNDKKEDK